MANKKKAKKKAAKPAAKKVAAPVEAVGEKVEAKPAHVEEAFIKVCGTDVGGSVMMTQSEYDAYNAKNK